MNTKYIKKTGSVGRIKGFTIIEIMATMTIFSAFLVVALGATLAIIEANTKAQSLKLAINNLNFNIEKMSRDIRSGSSYFCGIPSGRLTATDWNDCTAASGGPGNVAEILPYPSTTGFAFVNKTGQMIIYRLDATKHLKVGIFPPLTAPDDISNINLYQPFTSEQVTFSRMFFFVNGANPNTPSNREQPTVTVVMQGAVGIGNTRSSFNIQTMMTRRSLDVD